MPRNPIDNNIERAYEALDVKGPGGGYEYMGVFNIIIRHILPSFHRATSKQKEEIHELIDHYRDSLRHAEDIVRKHMENL